MGHLSVWQVRASSPPCRRSQHNSPEERQTRLVTLKLQTGTVTVAATPTSADEVVALVLSLEGGGYGCGD